MIWLVSNEGGVVVCSSLRESFFMRPNVVFVGFMMDGEARSFIVPLKTPTSSSMVNQGAEPVNEMVWVLRGARESRTQETEAL